MHPIHVLADPSVHQAVAYVPMTAKDKATAIQAGIVAGLVVIVLILASLAFGGRKAAAESK